MPTQIVKGDGEGYAVARVVLEDNINLPLESECLVWGKVNNPKLGLPAVLEPLSITEAVSSGSVATQMDPRVPSGSATSPAPKHSYLTEFVLVSWSKSSPTSPLPYVTQRITSRKACQERRAVKQPGQWLDKWRKCNGFA